MTRRRSDTANLTKRVLDKLEYPHPKGDRRSFYAHDGELERFSVRVYPSGRKTFVIRAWVDGKQREVKIGVYGPLTVDEARRLARARLFELDERLTLTHVENEHTSAPTFNEFVERYFKQHANNLRSADEQRRLIRRRLADRFGDTPIDRITTDEVLEMRTELAEKPYEANRAMDLLKTILNRAKKWDVLPASFHNPVSRVDRFQERPRERVLTQDEVRRLIDAVDAIDSVHTRVLFLALLDLPLRKSEIMRATWEGFDADTATLRIQSKSSIKGVSAQAMSPELVEEVAALPRFEDNPFIFPSRNRKSHIKDIDSQWKRIKEVAGVTNARLHDLRRTIATEYARLGATEYQIQAALGQRTNIAARHYVHLASAETSRGLMELRRAARTPDLP